MSLVERLAAIVFGTNHSTIRLVHIIGMRSDKAGIRRMNGGGSTSSSSISIAAGTQARTHTQAAKCGGRTVHGSFEPDRRQYRRHEKLQSDVCDCDCSACHANTHACLNMLPHSSEVIVFGGGYWTICKQTYCFPPVPKYICASSHRY